MLYCIKQSSSDTEFTVHFGTNKQIQYHLASLGPYAELVHVFTELEYQHPYISKYVLNRINKEYENINDLEFDLDLLGYTSWLKTIQQNPKQTNLLCVAFHTFGSLSAKILSNYNSLKTSTIFNIYILDTKNMKRDFIATNFDISSAYQVCYKLLLTESFKEQTIHLEYLAI